jgi:hypothetical protein
MMTDLVERVKQAQAAAIDGLRGEDNLPTFEEEVEVPSLSSLRKRRGHILVCMKPKFKVSNLHADM